MVAWQEVAPAVESPSAGGRAGHNWSMRWSDLFDDLEAQLAALERAELVGEIAEHTRAERGRVSLTDRLMAMTEAPVEVLVAGGERLGGEVADVAEEWFVVRGRRGISGRGEEVLVRTQAVLALQGLGERAEPGGGGVRRRFDLRLALRAVSRDRAVVRVSDVVGGRTTGTIDRVGRDHLDLGVHPEDLPRRATALRTTTVVPFAALATVRRLV